MISGPRTIINRKFESGEGAANGGSQASRRHINCTHEVITSLGMTKCRLRRCALLCVARRRTSSNNSMHFSLPLAITCQYLSTLLHATLTHIGSNASYSDGRETNRVYFTTTPCLNAYLYMGWNLQVYAFIYA